MPIAYHTTETLDVYTIEIESSFPVAHNVTFIPEQRYANMVLAVWNRVSSRRDKSFLPPHPEERGATIRALAP
jgi:hypothetical protein